MSKILITGGAGFIGSHLADFLYDLGLSVALLDLPGQFSKQQLLKYETYECDITDSTSLSGLPDFNVLYHLAAEVGTANSLKSPLKDMQCNIQGTLNMINFAANRSIKKFIFASSMAVYGEAENCLESRSRDPISPYGISKSCGEDYINHFQRSNPKVDCILFRIFNCYGPNQQTSNLTRGLLSIFLQQVKKGDTINVTGNLLRKRDVIHVKDVTSALALPAQDIKMRGAYNVCSGKAITIQDLIYKIIQVSGKDKTNFVLSNIGSTGSDPHNATGSNYKLKKTGWKPSIELEEGIYECWDMK